MNLAYAAGFVLLGVAILMMLIGHLWPHRLYNDPQLDPFAAASNACREKRNQILDRGKPCQESDLSLVITAAVNGAFGLQKVQAKRPKGRRDWMLYHLLGMAIWLLKPLAQLERHIRPTSGRRYNA